MTMSEELQQALHQQIEQLLEKAEKALTVWAESCGLLEHYIVIYEDETGAPLPDELSARVALVGFRRKRTRTKK